MQRFGWYALLLILMLLGTGRGQEQTGSDITPLLSYIAPDCDAVLILSPRHWFSFELAGMPVSIASVMTSFAAPVGLTEDDLRRCEAVFVQFWMTDPHVLPEFASVIQFENPPDSTELLERLLGANDQIEKQGLVYHKGRREQSPSALFLDDHTLLLGSEKRIECMRNGFAESSIVKNLLSKVEPEQELVLAIRAIDLPEDLIRHYAQGLSNSPDDEKVQDAAVRIAQSSRGLLARVDLGPPPVGRFALLTKDVKTAAITAADFATLRESMAEVLTQPIKQALKLLTPSAREQQNAITNKAEAGLKMAQEMMRRLFPHADRQWVTSTARSDADIGIALALVVPAMEMAHRESLETEATNHMRLVWDAFVQYQKERGSLPPPAVHDAEGNPCLSWRVALLPYLGQRELYERFNLAEPWDSEHNKPLADHMPVAFQDPRHPQDIRTRILLPVGEGTLFPEATATVKLAPDEEPTILLVHAVERRGVLWTKPDDLMYHKSVPHSGLKTRRSSDFPIIDTAGNLQRVAADIPDYLLRQFFNPRHTVEKTPSQRP